MIWTIARRELRALFMSPLAWSILAIIQLILAFLFLGHLDVYLQVQPRLALIPNAPGITAIIASPVLGNASVLLLLIVPMLSMRLISEERRNRTMTLLFSAPVSMTEIALGKYLGLVLFLLFIVGVTALMPLSLLIGGHLDFGMFAAGLIGLTLLLSAFAAIGLFVSAISPNPTIAGIGTFGILFLFWIADWSASDSSGPTHRLLRYVSLVRHYEPFLRGVFNSADVAYFVLMSVVFLGLTIRRLDADRLGT
ncbi:MAG: ABC transporter permease [Acidiferrobacteraceae bacterium]